MESLHRTLCQSLQYGPIIHGTDGNLLVSKGASGGELKEGEFIEGICEDIRLKGVVQGGIPSIWDFRKVPRLRTPFLDLQERRRNASELPGRG